MLKISYHIIFFSILGLIPDQIGKVATMDNKK